jgi:aminoglycoside phosphotransferase (APT) family kinase protein
MNEAQVATYLTQRLTAPVKVVEMKRSFPGMSRETWLLRTEVANEPQGFVLRIDPPEGGGCPGDLRQEYEVYRRLFRSEVPVAEPLWYDDSLDFVEGRPHMVRRMAEGRPTVDGLFDGDDSSMLRRRVAFECVERLAAVHLLDWKAYRFDELLVAPPSAAESFTTEFTLWRRYWYERRPTPAPVFEEVLAWLGEQIPRDTPRVSLVKGNNGLGEEIWRDGKIVAMSDWELASLGDGISDLFWSQGTVRLVGFSEVLRHYEECMGQSVSSERLAYASIFALVKQLISMRAFWYRHYHVGETRKVYGLSSMTFSIEAEHRLGRCIGKSLEEAYALVNASEKSMYAELAGDRK